MTESWEHYIRSQEDWSTICENFSELVDDFARKNRFDIESLEQRDKLIVELLQGELKFRTEELQDNMVGRGEGEGERKQEKAMEEALDNRPEVPAE